MQCLIYYILLSGQNVLDSHFRASYYHVVLSRVNRNKSLINYYSSRDSTGYSLITFFSLLLGTANTVHMFSLQGWVCSDIKYICTVESQVLTCLLQIAYEGDFWCLCTVTFWQFSCVILSWVSKNKSLIKYYSSRDCTGYSLINSGRTLCSNLKDLLMKTLQP